jgi:hypothetical protein
MRSFGVFSIAIAIALTGCSGSTAKVPPAAAITAPHVASPTYTVTAILEAYPDGTVRACQTMELSYPGECGSSVLVTHLGSARLPFDGVAWTRGAYFTPTMQLIGTWTGTSLALTSPPVQSASQTEAIKVWLATKPPSPPQMHAGYPTAAGFRDQQVLLADNADLLGRGILVMENGFGAAGLYIMVAVGDPATVDLLRSRYRVQEIDSWLSPTP